MASVQRAEDEAASEGHDATHHARRRQLGEERLCRDDVDEVGDAVADCRYQRQPEIRGQAEEGDQRPWRSTRR
jgi:hypothetical protein